MDTNQCQAQSLKRITIGRESTPPLPLFRRLKLEMRRRLSLRTIRRIQNLVDHFYSWFSKFEEKSHPGNEIVIPTIKSRLQPGDIVRVRSKEEIQATLNRWGEFRGCGFMDDMWQYCDSTQVVVKPLQRFVDERDYQIKRTKGIVLLEGLHCQGTPIFGRCDRNCFYFWREEWLEKIQ